MDCLGDYRLHRTDQPHFTEPEPRRPGIDATARCHDGYLLWGSVAPRMEQATNPNRHPSGDDAIEHDDGSKGFKWNENIRRSH